jgi:uncharacterized membrane protein
MNGIVHSVRAVPRRWLALLALCLPPGIQAASPPAFVLTDLGPVEPVDVNNFGQIAGNGGNGAVLFSSGAWQPLGAFKASGLNDHGQVAGSVNSTTLVRYSGGSVKALGDATAFFDTDQIEDTYIVPFRMNNNGVIVGIAGARSADNSIPFKYENGSLRFINQYSEETVARDVNQHGTAVGYTYGIGATGDYVSWTVAANSLDAQVIGESQGLMSRAYAINDNGVVAGFQSSFVDPSLSGLPFIYDNGVVTWLPGGAWAPVAINNSGRVVGDSGVLYVGAVTYTLNSLLSATDAIAWNLHSASDMNDRGQIVGTGTINGAEHGYLLTPAVPEPSTCPLMVVGVLLLVCGLRGRVTQTP